MIETKTIDETATMVMAAIDSLPSSIARDERVHVLAVVRYADTLAVRRRLDRDLLQLAAWLHDLGRYGAQDRGHGKRSARLAGDYLLEEGVPAEAVEKIVAIIRHHTKKDRVDDDSSEALKDADCLAQLEAGTLDTTDPLRVIRAQGALALEPPTAGDEVACKAYVQTTLDQLRRLGDVSVDPESVHDLRVACRRLRSILASVGAGKGILEPVKELSHHLGRAREAAVNVEIARKHLGKKTIRLMEKTLEREEKKVAAKLKERVAPVIALDEQIDSLAFLPTEAALVTLDPVRMLGEEDWHVRRVAIKHLRYAVESSLLRCRERDGVVERLKRLQDIHGDWHDLKRFLATVPLRKEDTRTIKRVLAKAEKALEEETKSLLFWIRYHL